MKMRYDKKKKDIIVERELSVLDRLALQFTRIIKKYVDYVIVSGYVSILLGRARATEDIDIFIESISEEKFLRLYKELEKKRFWCLNTDKPKKAFSYLQDGLAIRFSRKGTAVPNFEVKFPKDKIDKETFQDYITVTLPSGSLKVSSLERQAAFKRYYLKSDKDIEDAIHIEEIFKDKIDFNKIKELKKRIEREK
jgi:hypothetical protein